MSKEQPLPFVYQFAAGAVAGVSEVSDPNFFSCSVRCDAAC
jgi:hypothetical protein